MSRTKRYIPTWASRPGPFELTQRGLGREWEFDKEDPRHRWAHGYDRHKATSYIYTHCNCKHAGYGEPMTGKTRKWFKREYAKGRRRLHKREIAGALILYVNETEENAHMSNNKTNEPDYGDREPRPNEPNQPAKAPPQPAEEAPHPDNGQPGSTEAPKGPPGTGNTGGNR